MNKEQLSDAVGTLDEALLAETMAFEGRPSRRKWSRGAVVAVALAAALAVGALAVELAGGWRLQATTADTLGISHPLEEDEPVLMGQMEAEAYPLSERAREYILSHLDPESDAYRDPREDVAVKYGSLEEIEDAYDIRLLRTDPEEPYANYADTTWVGESYDLHFGEDGLLFVDRSELMLMGHWNTRDEKWEVSTSFHISTAGGVIHSGRVGVTPSEITEHEIEALGITAQIAVLEDGGGHYYKVDSQGKVVGQWENDSNFYRHEIGYRAHNVLVYFTKDGIAYDMDFSVLTREDLSSATASLPNVSYEEEKLPTEDELMDWVYAKLETLHY